MATERPILFSGAMVRAILEGRKPLTRRPVKPSPVDMVAFIGKDNLPTWEYGWCSHERVISKHIACPHGNPGDHLWVRETFALQCNVEDDKPPFSDSRPIKRFDNADESGWLQPHYRASDPQPEITCPENPHHNCGSEDICASPWQPSIHMPRWASRLTLEITNVRAERVHEITTEDIIAEGLSTSLREHDAEVDLRDKFKSLWDSVYEKRGFGWDKNPWVWAITFKKLVAGEPSEGGAE